MALAKEENSSEFVEALAHIWNHTFKFINSMYLKCAIELGLPQIIHNHGKPITLSHLINALPCINKAKSHTLHRLMQTLTHSGIFIAVETLEHEETKQAYWLTPSSRLLLRDGPLSLAPLLQAKLDPILMEPWHFLTEWIVDDRGGSAAFDVAHGRRRWEGGGSIFDEVFNEAMASDARLVARIIGGDLKRMFEGLESVVDVGGARGEMAKAIAAACPNLNCIVLDLPHVVCGLEGDGNLIYVGGDMFEFIPPANAVLMKWILHCWSDEESVEILKKCKEALIPSKDKGGKVIIIEMVMNPKGEHKAFETQLFFDMETMVLVNGRERSEKQWANLFFTAGFTSYNIFPILGLRCLIEAYL